jgi:hypothetical protein
LTGCFAGMVEQVVPIGMDLSGPSEEEILYFVK